MSTSYCTHSIVRIHITSLRQHILYVRNVAKRCLRLTTLRFLQYSSHLDTHFFYDCLSETSEQSFDVFELTLPGTAKSTRRVSKPDPKAIKYAAELKQAIEFVQRDNEFLIAAELGNYRLVESLLSSGTINVQEKDHIGRTALHLAVCSNSLPTIQVLLNAGIEVSVKDKVGMTPLSLCLMRRPSVIVASLLFDHGASIIPRTNPMDTGLFLQFVIMCEPTDEEAKILRLLVDKGAKVNDLEAPGGRQALHFAAMSNNCKLIKLLLEFGADWTLTNHRKETPRQVAETFNCRKAQAFLERVERGDEDPSFTGTSSLENYQNTNQKRNTSNLRRDRIKSLLHEANKSLGPHGLPNEFRS